MNQQMKGLHGLNKKKNFLNEDENFSFKVQANFGHFFEGPDKC